MLVKDIMTPNPVFADKNARVIELARMMREHNCGEIPICDEEKVVGVVTDRDIACRVVAEGKDALATTADEIMSSPPYTARTHQEVEDAITVMERQHVARLPVVDREGRILGMLSHSDVALRVGGKRSAELARRLSERAPHSSL